MGAELSQPAGRIRPAHQTEGGLSARWQAESLWQCKWRAAIWVNRTLVVARVPQEMQSDLERCRLVLSLIGRPNPVYASQPATQASWTAMQQQRFKAPQAASRNQIELGAGSLQRRMGPHHQHAGSLLDDLQSAEFSHCAQLSVSHHSPATLAQTIARAEATHQSRACTRAHANTRSMPFWPGQEAVDLLQVLWCVQLRCRFVLGQLRRARAADMQMRARAMSSGMACKPRIAGMHCHIAPAWMLPQNSGTCLKGSLQVLRSVSS